MNTLHTILATCLIILSACALQHPDPEGSYRIDNTLVYTTSQDTVDFYRHDCEKRNGQFNECGSACKPGDICIAVCALTCENLDDSFITH